MRFLSLFTLFSFLSSTNSDNMFSYDKPVEPISNKKELLNLTTGKFLV